MSPTALIPIADGSEEIEAVTIIDVLRRAGIAVTVASVMDRPEITASRGVRIVADRLISEVADQDFDLIVLPGGMPGAEHLRDNEILTDMLRRHAAANRLMGAICAAPAVALEAHGFLENRAATAHPGFFDRLNRDRRSEARVVADGHVVTSRGPGTALEFALRLVALLRGEDAAAEVAAPMVTR
jgi:4-methyl-5(b-hydroxyethyl)-thiazole monophosphate biosynthesis